ncbi:MAG: hypothetical protein JRJ47_08175 [Deltaproteobacteria bacterium]|nr:hypothetical protein [Deltaproteobacteria bacterium]
MGQSRGGPLHPLLFAPGLRESLESYHLINCCTTLGLVEVGETADHCSFHQIVLNPTIINTYSRMFYHAAKRLRDK